MLSTHRLPGASADVATVNSKAVPSRYFLAPHAYASIHSNELFILDLKKDKYISIDLQSCVGLPEVIAGWPLAPAPVFDVAADIDAPLPQDAMSTLAALVERGLVVQNEMAAARDERIEALAVEREWGGDLSAPRIGLSDVSSFAKACALAKVRLRLHSLEYLVRRSLERNRAFRIATCDIGREEAVWEVIGKHAYLRPWFYSATDMCVFECLVLLEFLAQFHFSIDWVFGVRADPFAAHCWLQFGNCVVNDTIENVSRFSPIMNT